MTPGKYTCPRLIRRVIRNGGGTGSRMLPSRFVRVSAAIALSVGIVSAIPGSQASASGGGDGCNPGRSNNYVSYYFDGAFSQPGKTMGGVYAKIGNYSPFVYNTSGDTVTEWVMLVTTSNNSLYTQVGWWESPGGVRYTFDEYSLGSGAYHNDFYPAYSINSQIYYDMLWNSNSGFTFEANNQVVNTYQNYFTPNSANVYAEIHTQASQMPGGNYNGNYVSDMHGYVSGGWYNFNGDTQTLPQTSWGGETPWFQTGVNQFVTWDHACSY